MDKHLSEEHVVSYLPLAHIAAQTLDIYITLTCGGTTWFALPDALKVWCTSVCLSVCLFIHKYVCVFRVLVYAFM